MPTGQVCSNCGAEIPCDAPTTLCTTCRFTLGQYESAPPAAPHSGKQQPFPSEREIFFAALDREAPEERGAFLDAVCAGDANLRRRVEALLADHFNSDAFMKHLPAESLPTLLHPGAPSEEVGTVVGRYKLLEKLGEGGFGSVWAAEQREPFKRRVALKIIKLGMDTRQVVARFEAERQALALMDHPNIAKVLDAGSTETGRPYFVMELVRGIPITRYCDENSLPIPQRLELLVKICHAVQHAHQKGIIHRDLKPSNILVTLHDGVPVPKVIDFGIAKATQQELTEKTIYTHFQQFIGTPAYMSPEQAELSRLDIDTRSDIYSLGVLLYELLTGSTPFDAKELLAAGLNEMRRIIREQEPLRPSTRLTRQLRTGHPPKSQIAMTGATAAVATALVLGIAMSLWSAAQARQARVRAEGNEQKAWRAQQDALDKSRLAEAERHRAGHEAEQPRRELDASEMLLAFQSWEAGHAARTRGILETLRPQPGHADFRGFEWRYLWGLSRPRESFTLQISAGAFASVPARLVRRAPVFCCGEITELGGRSVQALLRGVERILVAGCGSDAEREGLRLLRAFEMLREQGFKLWTANEDQITAALRSVIENTLVRLPVFPGSAGGRSRPY